VGLFGDMRKMMKGAKDLQKAQGGTGLRDTVRMGASMMDQAKSALADNQEQGRIAAEGRDGTATITAVRDTQMTLNQLPVLEFDLDVVAGGFGPYPVTIQQVVSRPAVARLQPGAEAAVKVDAEDPKTVVLVGDG